jgi:hypothetical protein
MVRSHDCVPVSPTDLAGPARSELDRSKRQTERRPPYQQLSPQLTLQVCPAVYMCVETMHEHIQFIRALRNPKRITFAISASWSNPSPHGLVIDRQVI